MKCTEVEYYIRNILSDLIVQQSTPNSEPSFSFITICAELQKNEDSDKSQCLLEGSEASFEDKFTPKVIDLK